MPTRYEAEVQILANEKKKPKKNKNKKNKEKKIFFRPGVNSLIF